MGGTVKLVFCDRQNIKITDQHDLAYSNKMVSASRIGIGVDSHSFSEKKPLMLGGLKLSDKDGFEGNSDGDVILHALFNALGTAIGFKSIGFYADEMAQKGVTDSKKYLEFILEKVSGKNLKISNMAIMLEGKKPNVDEHSDKIKDKISKLTKVKKENIGIAATSGEELTEFGKGKGMQAVVVVMLRSG